MRLTHRVPQLSRAFFPVSALLLSLVFLAGCSLLIPEDQSAPRYNTVVGHRHTPPLNPGGSGEVPYQAPQQAGAPSSMVPPEVSMAPTPGASAAPTGDAPQAAAYPPADQQSQAAAQQPMNQPPPSPQPQRSVWQHLAFWNDDTVPPTPPPAASVSVAARQVPVENVPAETGQLAGNYPSLQDVPPRPPMTDSTRMGAIGQQMQQDQLNATANAAKLDADAAREPMLSPLPASRGAAPVPAPVSVTPLPPPPGAMAAPANAPPPMALQQPMNTAPQATSYPMFPPPPPPMASNAAPTAYAPPAPIAYVPPAPIPVPAPQVAYAPAPAPQVVYVQAPPVQVVSAPPAPALEPIVLHPPGSAAPLPPPSGAGYQPAPLAVSSSQPAAMPGGFDPMAGTPASGAAAGQQVAGAAYLPDSRYVNRRAWQ
ncbi:MAG: hypothetical protein WDN72_08670 [Alphaproteobacteria bacterium]